MSDVVPVLDLEGEPHAEVFADGPRTVRLRLGTDESVPPHRHPGNDVLLYVLEGRFELSIDEASHELVTGDAVRFDGDREVSPRAEEPTTALVVFAPREP